MPLVLGHIRSDLRASPRASPPKKRSKPLLLGPPGAEDVIPEANRMQYKSPGGYGKGKGKDTNGEDENDELGQSDSLGDSKSNGSAQGDVDDDDDDDEFAKMVSSFSQRRLSFPLIS